MPSVIHVSRSTVTINPAWPSMHYNTESNLPKGSLPRHIRDMNAYPTLHVSYCTIDINYIDELVEWTTVKLVGFSKQWLWLRLNEPGCNNQPVKLTVWHTFHCTFVWMNIVHRKLTMSTFGCGQINCFDIRACAYIVCFIIEHTQ